MVNLKYKLELKSVENRVKYLLTLILSDKCDTTVSGETYQWYRAVSKAFLCVITPFYNSQVTSNPFRNNQES